MFTDAGDSIETVTYYNERININVICLVAGTTIRAAIIKKKKKKESSPSHQSDSRIQQYCGIKHSNSQLHGDLGSILDTVLLAPLVVSRQCRTKEADVAHRVFYDRLQFR